MQTRILLVTSLLIILSCQQKNNTAHSDAISPVKPFYFSDVRMTEDSVEYSFRICQAFKRNDSLSILFNDTLFYENPYQLEILKHANHLTARCFPVYNYTDSTYKPPIFSTLYQSINLNKDNFTKGDSLNGSINLKVRQVDPDLNLIDTISILGTFKTIVQ